MMNTREEFEKLWSANKKDFHQNGGVVESYKFTTIQKTDAKELFEAGYEACQAFNDKRIAELEEKRIMQLSAISTASIGYFKDGETIHSDYDTTALRDVTNLYAKVAELEEKLRVAEQRQAYSSTSESNWD